MPRLSIVGEEVPEGDTGVGTLTFTVTLSRRSSQTVRVGYATEDLTATAGTDYGAATGTLRFRPGSKRKTIEVSIMGDTVREAPQEYFSMVLSEPRRAKVGQGTGTGAIGNDDPPAPGDVIISEVLADPSGTDAGNEFVELFNPTAVSQSLDGWALFDAGDAGCSIQGAIAPGDSFVLSGNATIADFPCTSMPLGNAGDSIRLVVGGFPGAGVVDQMTFPAATSGASWSLDPDHLSSVGNDTTANWCNTPAGNTYNGTDLGTPGSANPQCP